MLEENPSKMEIDLLDPFGKHIVLVNMDNMERNICNEFGEIR